MIPLKDTFWQSESWQQQMSGMIRDPIQLLHRLDLNPIDHPFSSDAIQQFPLRVTEAFVAKMAKGDWNDPLLLQVMPLHAESNEHLGYVNDPLEESLANPVPGLIHKYHGRVLLITSPACAIHCRYCFRRNFPYDANNPSQRDWKNAIDYISERPDISEVILSGGDPLSAPDEYLQKLLTQIAAIPHVTTLRLHTRLPLVLPARVTPALIDVLKNNRLRIVIVIHCNHANEIDEHTTTALAALHSAGFTLLNQSVLLKGINDNVDTLVVLSLRLFEVNVMPYYLHLLDKVRGAAHFEIDEEQAKFLMNGILSRLPGYLVPRLVIEEPGATSKRPLALS
ncbi:L-lysine 2,3-aminomutase [Zhongshania aliphaticivorans]|uniref:L-lysine 2,3-aminomutase n=1 Tax=Zhongshania aliphaticivorans TaxID=1470434 RepID=A0A5S9MWI0_9GAMM|nr:EF-P beta-lysylation protein EpmB [Zhongshania aliphaticivorans]CAA0081780.1 L-lysine 2,3-aminomutase [Zhongshania aliphaticivorans]CAA0084761.1 L-lysine 2,3-aminomutase [Zhongshania aliphaticivorans]